MNGDERGGDSPAVRRRNLIATVMQLESCGDPRAGSKAGASGLFQVMPFHFQQGEDPLDPGTNAQRGLGYLHSAMKQADGDVRLALAGYNGGIGLIGASALSWPAETQRYSTWGAAIYQDARQGETDSPALQDWLRRGGMRLCAQASIRLRLQQ